MSEPDRRPAGRGGGTADERPPCSARGAARLASLQAARGIAAVLVVLYHCSTAIFGLAKYAPRDPFHHAFGAGRLGVELFFVISGFVIHATHRADVSRPDRLGRFLRKRVLRIYPLYWVVLAALLPAYAALPHLGTGSELKPLTILSSVLLVHLGTPSMVLCVSWTLCFEILFYALFATLILDRRLGVVVLSAWWALAVVRVLAAPSLLRAYPFSDYTLLFPLGMAASFLLARGRVARPLGFALGGSALFVLNGLLDTYAPTLGRVGVHLVAGLSAAMLLAGFGALERQGRLRVPRLLVVLGDSSYAIYLIHFTALSLLAKILLPRALHVLPPFAVASVLILLAVAAGVVLHAGVERPLRAIATRKREGAPGVRRALASPSVQVSA